MAKAKPFKRTGLHRLQCECGNYVYATVAALEAHGLPTCPCGGRLDPDRWELCLILRADDAPAAIRYRDAMSGAVMGQHGGSSFGAERQDPHYCQSIIALELDREREARERRLAAIQPQSDDTEMPF